MDLINVNDIKTPAYIVDEELLIGNLKVLKSVMDQTGCKILLAQKAFSMYSLYPLIGQYLCGTTASSLYEAKLGKEEMGKETHIYAPSYKMEEFEEIAALCDHVVFNSLDQFHQYKDIAMSKACSCGIRINPQYAEVAHEIYNPCCVGSRLGTTISVFEQELKQDSLALDGIEGIHFHVMCEQNSDTLVRVLQHVEAQFGKYMALPQIQWINFGGGHHITRQDYDIEQLIKCIDYIKNKYHVQVYLEPGEAVALNTGFLAATVLSVQKEKVEICNNGANTSYQVIPAILDVSAACHMPDVLEMPYRPMIISSEMPGTFPFTYRFGGNTCLAGDIIGDYSFDHELAVGEKIVFTDMAHYSMVKNNTFNGIALPSIMAYNKERGVYIVKEFGYEDFKERLS